ncbi:MAG: DNA internalization-related competence protein ComEC/Rec2 [Oscillibacter sp.]|nr:DNA internalization-related competence protein ComEC/Rec2 [Oscillibacter sp.]
MRKLAYFAFSFSAAIFLAQYLLAYESLLRAMAAALAAACGALFLPDAWRRRLLLIGVGASLAFGYNWLYTRQVQLPAERLADTDAVVTMILQDYAVAGAYGGKVTVKIEGVPGKAVYYGDDGMLDLRPGQTLTGSVHLKSAAQIRDDDVTSFTSKGVFLLAYNRGEMIAEQGSANSVRWWPARMGRAMRTQINRLFSGDTAGFLTAILTGDKSGISERSSIAMSEAGIYHILAVSGMHCMFLAEMAIGLLGRHRKRMVAAWTLPMLVFYALLTGGSPSVVRAGVMLGLLLSAPLFGRDSDGPTSLSAALLLILLKNPFAAASVSLQLSFAAMAGIILVSSQMNRLLLGGRKHGKLYRFTASSVSATAGATLFTLPLSGWYFGTLVLISPVANLLCLWCASIVFMLGLTAVMLSFLWLPLGAVVGFVPRLLVVYILRMAGLLAAVPYHALYFSNPYLKFWLAFFYILLAVVCFSRQKRRASYGLAAVLAAVTLVCTVYLGAARFREGKLHIMALDVGQGQSVLLSSGDAYALVDCGGGNSWYDAGQIAAGQLHTMGCRELDYLVLTHYDSDHVNGLSGLLARMPVDVILAPEQADEDGLQAEILALAADYKTEVRFVETISTHALGEAELTLYPPVGEGGDNERGIAALCTAGDYDLLITGDLDMAGERQLLERYNLPDIEMLMVGHHGSKYSTSEELLTALTPETAIVSCGSNSYGHPTEETLRRLVTHGAELFRTDLQGTIHFTLN